MNILRGLLLGELCSLCCSAPFAQHTSVQMPVGVHGNRSEIDQPITQQTRFQKSKNQISILINGSKLLIHDVGGWWKLRNVPLAKLSYQQVRLVKGTPKNALRMLPLMINPLPPPFGLVLLSMASLIPRTMLTHHFYSREQKVKFSNDDVNHARQYYIKFLENCDKLGPEQHHFDGLVLTMRALNHIVSSSLDPKLPLNQQEALIRSVLDSYSYHPQSIDRPTSSVIETNQNAKMINDLSIGSSRNKNILSRLKDAFTRATPPPQNISSYSSSLSLESLSRLELHHLLFAFGSIAQSSGLPDTPRFTQLKLQVSMGVPMYKLRDLARSYATALSRDDDRLLEVLFQSPVRSRSFKDHLDQFDENSLRNICLERGLLFNENILQTWLSSSSSFSDSDSDQSSKSMDVEIMRQRLFHYLSLVRMLRQYLAPSNQDLPPSLQLLLPLLFTPIITDKSQHFNSGI